MRNRKWMLLMAGGLSAALFLSACESGSIEKTGEQTVEDSGKDEDRTEGVESEFSGVEHTEDSIADITEPATVTRVIDGDTIVIQNEDGEEETVRMLLIDAPELENKDGGSDTFSEEARDYAESWLLDSEVRIERGDPEKDKYGRTLAHVWMHESVGMSNFGENMVMQGFARVAYAEPGDKYLKEFEAEQEKAKKEELRIWSHPGFATENGFDESAYYR